MIIYIFADMEGISGISGSDFLKSDNPLFQDARKFYTMEINLCVNSCLKAGAKKVIVRDGHGAGHNVIWDMLDPNAELIQGNSGNKRFPGIEGCSAIIFLGYHAMAGTQNALLEHTYSSRSIQNMWLNGIRVGEFAIDSTIAAEYGVPTIMVSGDDKVCEEAKSWFPDVVTCQVKKSLTCQGAHLFSKKKTRKLIEEKTVEAIGKLSLMKTPQIKKPVKLRKEYVERYSPPIKSEFNVIDGRTVEITSDSLEKALFMMI